MRRPPVHIAALALCPSVALAHGEDALLLLFGEGIVVVGCSVASFVVLKARRAWVGIAVCLATVAMAWVITADMPYRDNQTLITSLHLGLPLLATAAAIVIARMFWAPAPNSAMDSDTYSAPLRAPNSARHRGR